jgi:hypothetical protein
MYQLFDCISIADDSAARPEPEGAARFSRPPWIALTGLHFTFNSKQQTIAKTVASKIVDGCRGFGPVIVGHSLTLTLARRDRQCLDGLQVREIAVPSALKADCHLSVSRKFDLDYRLTRLFD